MKFVGIFLLILIIKCSATYHFKGQISSCSTSRAKLQNIKVGFYPQYPQAGDVMKIYLNGTLSEMVTEGHVQVELYHDSIPPLKETHDLCYILSLAEINCPLKSGPASYRFNYPLPPYIPLGNYSAKAAATQQSNQEFFCLTARAVVQ
ncbi:uncharacterized protein [Dysidea avara]|uniref:uncharacterized protein n=1 Tax=Dysidea avara TaxID=196820 RepID=UPI00331EF1B5